MTGTFPTVVLQVLQLADLQPYSRNNLQVPSSGENVYERILNHCLAILSSCCMKVLSGFTEDVDQVP